MSAGRPSLVLVPSSTQPERRPEPMIVAEFTRHAIDELPNWQANHGRLAKTMEEFTLYMLWRRWARSVAIDENLEPDFEQVGRSVCAYNAMHRQERDRRAQPTFSIV